MTVYDFSADWYDLIVKQTFALRPVTQVANRPFGGGRGVSGTIVQAWVSSVTMAPLRDPVLQDMDAFFSRLRGQSGLMRLSNALRLNTWYDRDVSLTSSTWDDGSHFTDGSGFVNGYLPPEVYIATAAARGARFVVLGGLPASVSGIIRRGDLFQVKPNGIAGSVPHLYKAMNSASSNSSGQIGISIEPGLRQSVAAGDQVGLRYASSVFRLSDDSQAEIEGDGAGIGNFGFSVVEALDQVP